MKTRTELVHRALHNLGVLPQGQSPDVEEFNSVNALIDPMLEDLIARNVIHIQDADAIEERHFLHLGYVLAGLASPEFGMQNDPALAARAAKAEQDLEQIDMNNVRYRHLRTMRVDYPGVNASADASALFST